MAAVSTSSKLFSPAPPVTNSYGAGGAVVIVVSGALSSAGFATLDRLAVEAVESGCRHVVLDLHRVTRIDPEALGLLWGALRGIRNRGGTLAGAGAKPALRPGLEALGSGGLTLHGTVRAALAVSDDLDARS